MKKLRKYSIYVLCALLINGIYLTGCNNEEQKSTPSRGKIVESKDLDTLKLNEDGISDHVNNQLNCPADKKEPPSYLICPLDGNNNPNNYKKFRKICFPKGFTFGCGVDGDTVEYRKIFLSKKVKIKKFIYKGKTENAE